LANSAHGGFDGGAVANDGTIEKDLNLSIALKLASIMDTLGYNAVLVRDRDISTASGDDTGSKKVSDIKNRLKLTEKYKNAILISIHMNKYSTAQPRGAQIFYANIDGSKQLAECIQTSVKNLVQRDNNRVVKKTTKDIYLLNRAVVPSVIAECGFLSNQNDLNNLKNEQYQQKMALAIAVGVVDYFKNEI
jgi:N-acetylmuramoyl-L-alanine amidase